MQSTTSVDPKSNAHFHKLADTWWDADGPFWPLHKLNSLRIEWIMAQLNAKGVLKEPQSLAGLSVLDVGCGGGILSETLAKLGASVTGIDVVDKNIRIARLHAEAQMLDIDYHLTTTEALAKSGQLYDVVFNMEVVEHVADLTSFMHACNTLVKPGGYQFIATINRNPLAGLIAIFGAEYVLQWLPKGTHQYQKLVKPSEIRTHLNKGNFHEVANTGVKVNPFRKSMSVYSKLWVNYMLLAQKSK
jgi:2-polyprenyl-6-hydroxyphenyl methylase/3-demethylubiquinone-9 3-methyltransferase